MEILNIKPKIYGRCPAGCEWETIHRDEFANAATYTPIYPNEYGIFHLELGKEYKIFAPKATGGKVFNCTLSCNTFGIDCTVDDEYAESFVFKWLGIGESFITYELAGCRFTETIDISSVPEYIELYGAERVYIYNADASIVVNNLSDEVMTALGEMDTVLDEIIAIQNALIGGESV